MGLRPPSYAAVRARAATLFTSEEIVKRRSANPNHLHRLKPRPGYISAPRPLAVTQIDHTPTDIHFVEVIDGAGAFVGCAYRRKTAIEKTRGAGRPAQRATIKSSS